MTQKQVLRIILVLHKVPMEVTTTFCELKGILHWVLMCFALFYFPQNKANLFLQILSDEAH